MSILSSTFKISNASENRIFCHHYFLGQVLWGNIFQTTRRATMLHLQVEKRWCAYFHPCYKLCMWQHVARNICTICCRDLVIRATTLFTAQYKIVTGQHDRNRCPFCLLVQLHIPSWRERSRNCLLVDLT